jgi:predicted nucleic acid-binding protein
MADVFVVYASAIITLDKIGAVCLLARLADQVVVPGAVMTEIGRGPRPLLSC